MVAGPSEHQPAASARRREQEPPRRAGEGWESGTRAYHKTAWRESPVYRPWIQGESHDDVTQILQNALHHFYM